jgi:hypothetical protein
LYPKEEGMNNEKHYYRLKFHGSCLLSFTILILLGGLSSCGKKEGSSTANRVPMARVYGEFLYRDQLSGIVAAGTSAADSVKIIRNYIISWTKEALIYQKAESNLSDEQKNVDKQLQAYRKSLLLYAYEKELIRQKLDTVVSGTEIDGYYLKNQKDFQLKDNIIKVLYVKVKKKAPQLAKLKTLYRSDLVKDREALESYCHEFAENFFLDDNAWLLFDD